MDADAAVDAKSASTAAWKTPRTFPTAPTGFTLKSGQITCQTQADRSLVNNSHENASVRGTDRSAVREGRDLFCPERERSPLCGFGCQKDVWVRSITEDHAPDIAWLVAFR